MSNFTMSAVDDDHFLLANDSYVVIVVAKEDFAWFEIVLKLNRTIMSGSFTTTIHVFDEHATFSVNNSTGISLGGSVLAKIFLKVHMVQ